MSSRLFVVRVFAVVVALAAPRPASAQWYLAGYLGGNTTRPAAVSVTVPSADLSLQFQNVEFLAKPLDSPQYYGWRGGRLFGSDRRLGLEVEFIHLKVFADTSKTYQIGGQVGGEIPATAPMATVVQRYAMSHGLNFLLANLVMRSPIADGPILLVTRIGAGPTLPHAESTVLGQSQEQYEAAGLGVHAAAGIDIRLRGRLSVVAEYKYTYARPKITLAAGTAETTTTTHHVAIGLAFGLAR